MLFRSVPDTEVKVVEHRALLVDADGMAIDHRDIPDDDTETDRHEQHGLELVLDGQVEEKTPYGNHNQILVSALLCEEIGEAGLAQKFRDAFAQERRGQEIEHTAIRVL